VSQAQNRPKVGLFATCLVDLFRPSVGFSSAKLIEEAGCDVHVPKDCDAVLLGCALHAAVAAGAFPSVEEAGKAMQCAMAHFPPSPMRQAALARDHALLKAMMRHRDELAELASAPAPSPAAIHRAV